MKYKLNRYRKDGNTKSRLLIYSVYEIFIRPILLPFQVAEQPS